MREGNAPAPLVAATILVPAPRDRVWAMLTDFSAMHRWFVGLREVRLVGLPRVGAERLVTFVNGLTHREIVTAWEPCARLALVAPEASGLITAGASVDTHLRGTPQDGPQGDPQPGPQRRPGEPRGVLLTWCIDFQFSLWPPLASLTRPVARAVVGGALRISLRRLRKLAVSASQPG